MVAVGHEFHLAEDLDALAGAGALVEGVPKPVRNDHLDVDVFDLAAFAVIFAGKDGVIHFAVVERIILADAGRAIDKRIGDARHTAPAC